MRRIALAVATMLFVAAGAAAEPLSSPNAFGITPSGGGDALAQRRAERCQDRRVAPDERIEACQSLFRRHIIDDGVLWIIIATADEEKNDLPAALEAYQKAVDQGQEVEAIRRRALLYARTGQSDFAQLDGDRVVQIASGDAMSYALRCLVRGMTGGGPAETLADCDRALAMARDDKIVHDYRALTLLRLGRFDEAIADCNAAMGSEGKRPASLYLRGVIERKKGDAAAAAADIAAALASDSGVAARFERLGLKAEAP